MLEKSVILSGTWDYLCISLISFPTNRVLWNELHKTWSSSRSQKLLFCQGQGHKFQLFWLFCAYLTSFAKLPRNKVIVFINKVKVKTRPLWHQCWGHWKVKVYLVYDQVFAIPASSLNMKTIMSRSQEIMQLLFWLHWRYVNIYNISFHF